MHCYFMTPSAPLGFLLSCNSISCGAVHLTTSIKKYVYYKIKEGKVLQMDL